MSDRDPHAGPPTLAMRALHFLLGAMIGGALGYGVTAAGPAPPPPVFEWPGMAWVFGGALVCGVVGAAWPERFWRRSRKYSSFDARD